NIPAFHNEVIAVARSEVPVHVNQVSPVGIYCDSGCMIDLASGNRPWLLDGSTSYSFDYKPPNFDPGNGTELGPIQLPGIIDQFDVTDWQNFMACDPIVPNSPTCDQQDATAANDTAAASCLPMDDTCAYRRVVVDPATLRTTIEGMGAWPHLVPIYDDAV